MTYAVLGPRGTFSEDAACFYWGEKVNLCTAASITDLFIMVERGEVEGALVPIDNTLAGSINLTMECLEMNSVSIEGEFLLPIKQHLLSCEKYELEEVELLISQPAALIQCDRFIKTYLKGIRTEITDSTARAAKLLSEEPRKAVCIGSIRAAEIYSLIIIRRDIGDENNVTRFIHIARGKNEEKKGDKSSIIFSLPNKPGTLYRALGVFAKRNLNMSKIESRPSSRVKGSFSFYVEFDSPFDHAGLEEVLKELENHCNYIKYLGSYRTIKGEI
jgi:prephenate dehydratase